MRYTENPKNGDKLSMLGFGCMRFAGDSLALSFTGQFDARKAENLIVSAVEQGINYFDTAYIYSGSEELLGTALKKHGLREKVYIATKLPLILCRKASDIDKYFNAQLKRLKTDYIDYYLLHMLGDMKTWDTLCEWGIREWAEKKKASGEIKNFGFSFHGAQTEFLALLDAYDWDFCQIQYNYSDENYQAGVKGLRVAGEKGIPVIIMEPLLGGKLAKNLPDSAVARFERENPKVSPASWAFRWLYDQPEVSVVLSGMNEQDQLDENIFIVDMLAQCPLSREEHQVIDDVREIFNASYKVHCTGCHYCMPCPAGVDIPGCFSAYNARYSISKRQGMIQYYMSTLMNDKPSYASKCIGCGKCESHCPQNLKVREELKNVARDFETPLFRVSKKVLPHFVGKK